MKRKEIRSIALFAAFSLLLAGCGGSGSSASATVNDSYAMEEAAAEEADFGTADFYDEAEFEADSVEAARAEGAAEETTETEAAKSDEKLVYTCDLRMQTLTYAETLANIRKEIAAVGGIIENENETNTDYNWYSAGAVKTTGSMSIYLTVRIPSAKYKSFLTSLEGEGKVLSKNSYVENISRRYHDTEAVINNLETQEERLQSMMEQADTIEDMITIEARLTEVQTQLDQNRTYLASMDTDVAYSTVNLTLEEVMDYTPDPPKEDTFLDRLKNALAGSLENFRSFLETALFALIYIAPIALVVLAVVLIIRAIVKAWRKKHPKKQKETKKGAPYGYGYGYPYPAPAQTPPVPDAAEAAAKQETPPAEQASDAAQKTEE